VRGPRVERSGGRFRPLVVVPTKDNEASIEAVVTGCLEHCADVLVVDDGCADHTVERAARARGPRGEQAVIVHHAVNLGKGAALATAIDHAAAHGFTHVVAIDADGQHLPEELPRFFDAARRDPWAIIVGARDMAGAPGSSLFGRNFSNFWIFVETGHRVADSQCGFRVYPVAPVRSLRLRPGRYEWEVEVLVRGLWNGIAVRDLPCRVYYPDPEERVSSFRPWADNTRISLLNTKLVAMRILWPPHWINRVPEPGGTWQGQHRGRTGGWAFLLMLVRLLGRRAGHLLMWPMAVFYMLMARAPRQGVGAYLDRRMPGLSGPTRALRTLQVFHAFACSLVDRFHLLLRGPAAFRFEREGTDDLQSLPADQGAIFLTAHLGNADLAGAAASTGRLSQDTPRDVAIAQYASPDDPYLALLARFAGKPGVPRVVALNAADSMASLSLARLLRDGSIVALKADRAAGGRTARVSLLGGDVEIATGPFLLAALSGAPLFVLGCFSEGDGYRLVAEPAWRLRFTSRKTRDDDLERWAADYAAVLERWSARWPLQWFNFHDPWAGVAAAVADAATDAASGAAATPGPLGNPRPTAPPTPDLPTGGPR